MKRPEIVQILTRYFPAQEQEFLKAHKACFLWWQTTREIFAKLLIFSGCTWGLCSLLLYYFQSLWLVYLHTPMGKEFVLVSAGTAQAIINLVENTSLPRLAYEITLNALLSSLTVGIFSQFFGLRRRFYLGRGMINRVGWAALCIVFAAQNFFDLRPMEFQESVYLHTLPVICLCGTSFALAAKLVPEAGPVLEQLKSALAEKLHRLWRS